MGQDDSPANGHEDTGSGGPIERVALGSLKWLDVESRAFIVVSAIFALVIVAVAGLVSDRAVRIGALVLAAVMLGAIAILLYRLPNRRSPVDHELAAAFSSVGGPWWQLVLNDAEPGLSLIEVQLAQHPLRSHLGGRKWTPDGVPLANWSSESVGFLRIDPVEIFYVWEGSYMNAPHSVSGIGVFKFDSPSSASGWFTTGDVARLDFQVASKVHLRRATPSELKVARGDSTADRQQLVTSIQREWLAELTG